MKNVVTLISNTILLDENEVNFVVDALQNNGAIIEKVEWLSKDIACDIYFAVLNIEDANEICEHLLENVPFDFVIQESSCRKKRLLICDMDSTVIEQECIDEIADSIGIKDKVANITSRAMNGEIDFKDALKERVSLLKGVSEKMLQEIYDNNITLTSGVKELVATMKNNKATCVLVSGGFTFFSEKIAEESGFDIQEANILEVQNGFLTGEVREPILDSNTKLMALQFHAEGIGISMKSTLAIGDGANDVPMLKYAGLGIAFHAKPAVREQVRSKIDTCDLKALLYVQGYKESEILCSI